MSETTPRISIVMPSLNQAEFVSDAIRSVVEQGYPDVELLVVDGGSTDGAVDVIRGWESKITRWVSEPDRGQSDAINKGMRWATGEVVSWLNSDDLLLPGTLEMVRAAFRDPEVKVVHGRAELFGERYRAPRHSPRMTFDRSRALAGVVSQPSSFFRRGVLDDVGLLDTSLDFAMDYDLHVRAALSYPFVDLDRPLWKYRLHGASKTLALKGSFAPEIARVFSRVMRSLDAGQIIDQMRALGLYRDETERYQARQAFAEAEIRRAFSHFLRSQISYAYEALDLGRVRALSAFLKRWDPELYAVSGIGIMHCRARALPSFAIRLLRKITR